MNFLELSGIPSWGSWGTGRLQSRKISNIVPPIVHFPGIIRDPEICKMGRAYPQNQFPGNYLGSPILFLLHWRPLFNGMLIFGEQDSFEVILMVGL